ncbi:hypothetical protein B296_00015871 [Ensete ventricosum]|uniref:Uncharacterized protein n=1 Tax=Ensete ventricosum TaxID=4639 RepID=A0A427ARL3_ENSVE|nr:hypothetical protein B296_00015871 [Ensete ventricosum]
MNRLAPGLEGSSAGVGNDQGWLWLWGLDGNSVSMGRNHCYDLLEGSIDRCAWDVRWLRRVRLRWTEERGSVGAVNEGGRWLWWLLSMLVAKKKQWWHGWEQHH